jgi:predicted transcriptional regulator
MTAVELLQQIGLNKYEAEAYYTLLVQGPLTGYELGKRSQVPLSRSYEILERLAQKGLVLVQPGDPPYYAAEEAERLLGQVRSTMTATLDALATSLAALPRSTTADEYWVLRGRQHILDRARTLLADAQQIIDLSLSADSRAEIADALAQARSRGCRVSVSPTDHTGSPAAECILLLVDSRMALVGLLTPAERCQAVISANPALITAVSGYFTRQSPARSAVLTAANHSQQSNDPLDWVAWEDRKQRHLWSLNRGNRSA